MSKPPNTAEPQAPGRTGDMDAAPADDPARGDVAQPSAADVGAGPDADDLHVDAAGRESRGGTFQDAMRRMLQGGASALLNTEEGIRHAISEVKLPKEVLGYVRQQTERTRRDITGLVTKEVKKALARIDARKELQRALVGLKVDVRATVRFRRDETLGSRPEVGVRTKVRRRRVVADPAKPTTAPVHARDAEDAEHGGSGGLGGQAPEPPTAPAALRDPTGSLGQDDQG